MKKILINASNLHVGGGVQVAASFISELALILDQYPNANITILASSKVISSLSVNIDITVFAGFHELNVNGVKKIEKSQKELFNGFDVCFTIFGPFYHSLNVRKHVVGFAQPWIAYPNNEVYQKLSLFHRMRNYLKFYIQKLIFLKYDELIVEADHVKNALEQQGFTQHIHVVPNCVSSHFNSKYRTTPLRIDKSRGYVLGYLGKPYEHKNIELFAHVSKILRDKYNIDHQFVFSLTEEEMIRFGFHRIDNFLTFGELTSAECPAFYKSLDALVFPSLLECFSASPIEAMAMGVPVIASERPFISDFCKDSAVYFDPLSSCDIAEKISNTLSKPELMLQLSEKGKIIVSGMHSPRMRAIKYMNILVR